MACLERRLKRQLTIADFTACPANRMAFAAVGRISVVEKEERHFKQREEKARRAFLRCAEQLRQLPLDFPDDDDQGWDCIWSPS
jgi:hypothetical protein